MTTVFSAAAAIGLGALGWLCLEFIGRPLRLFADLRREVREKMMFHAEAFNQGYLTVADLVSTDDLKAGPRREFRLLGSQLVAFGEVEWPAMTILRWLKFDPAAAGYNLIGFAQSDGTAGLNDADAEISKALRFRP